MSACPYRECVGIIGKEEICEDILVGIGIISL